MTEIEIDRQQRGETSAIGVSKYVKIKALSPILEKHDYSSQYLGHF